MLIMTRETRLLRVSELREQRGWSISELANRAEIARNTARDYDLDVPENLNRTVLEKLARAFGVPIRQLFLEDSEGSN